MAQISMPEDTISRLLQRLEGTSESRRESVVRELLDHDSLAIDRLAETWCTKFHAPDDVINAWSIFAVFASVVFFVCGPLPIDPVPFSKVVWGMVWCAVGLVFALAYHCYGMSRHRKRRQMAEFAGEVLGHANRLRYGHRLLSNLYGFRDRKRQQITLVAPVADALVGILPDMNIDVRQSTERQKGCVLMHLSRVGEQKGREELALAFLDAIQRREAVEYLREVRRLARAARSPEVQRAAMTCSESLAAGLARQKEATLLLRATEVHSSLSTILVRPAGTGAEETDASVLLRADSDPTQPVTV